jgi:hypothetical protein
LTSNISALYNEIAKAAKTVAFQWPGIVEEDDLTQDISTHLLERPGSLEKLSTFDAKGKLNALIQIGHQIASKERLDYEVFSGNFRYSVDETKRLLEERALHNEDPELGSNWSIADDYTKSGEFEDAVNTKLSSETDLRRGMQTLERKNSSYAEVIRRRYLQDQLIPKEEEASRTRLKRALVALTTEMNRSFKQQQREHQGPGKRKPVSAAAAHYRSKANWDDESSEAVNRLLAQAKVSASR